MARADRRIVFVVGAGASKEFELPAGYELKEKIAGITNIRTSEFGSKLVSGDQVIAEALAVTKHLRCTIWDGIATWPVPSSHCSLKQERRCKPHAG